MKQILVSTNTTWILNIQEYPRIFEIHSRISSTKGTICVTLKKKKKKKKRSSQNKKLQLEKCDNVNSCGFISLQLLISTQLIEFPGDRERTKRTGQSS